MVLKGVPFFPETWEKEALNFKEMDPIISDFQKNGTTL